MNIESEFSLIKRKIDEEIDRFNLKLDGLTLFTEAASGLFSLTPFIAALGGAEKVFALEFESKYATIDEVRNTFRNLNKLFNLPNGKIELVSSKRFEELNKTDIITNSGGVRPIDKKTIENLKQGAVISLMFEGWEFRESDVDLESCKKNEILVFGTNEINAKVFDYCGILALKLLLEADVELLDQRMLLIGDQHFLKVIAEILENIGIEIVKIITNETQINEISDYFADKSGVKKPFEAIIVADAISKSPIVHPEGLIDPQKLFDMTKCQKLIQIAGKNDLKSLKLLGTTVHPNFEVDPQTMLKTLAYVGLTPLIRLQTAGLKVGELMVRCRKQYAYSKCIKKMMKESLITPILFDIFRNSE